MDAHQSLSAKIAGMRSPRSSHPWPSRAPDPSAVETTLVEELGHVHLIEDDRVYGYFPEFRDYVSEEAAKAAARRLRQIDRETVAAIVRSVPAQWGITHTQRETWVDVICKRAERVSGFIVGKLIKAPHLDLEA